MWPLARALAGDYRHIYIDHRGHGRGGKPHDSAANAMKTRVADAFAVLDALGIDRAHFAGVSWGAKLAFGVAEHARERMLTLVACGKGP